MSSTRTEQGEQMKTPKDYNLPHDEYRPGQEPAIAELVSTTPARGVTLVEAPTGSGKTSFAAANSTTAHAMSLVKTKMLQDTNYGDAYKFDVLKGRSNTTAYTRPGQCWDSKRANVCTVTICFCASTGAAVNT